MSGVPKPIAVTKDRVGLSRKAWNEIMEALEDAEDRMAIQDWIVRKEAGKDDGLSADLYWRMREGEHPVRTWRLQRKLSLNELARMAGVARAYLSEIETGKKPGSVAAFQRIARALGVDIDDLVATRQAAAGKIGLSRTKSATRARG